MREFGEAVGIGDRLGFGPIELVVRTLGDDGRIETVGLRLVRARLERGEPGGPRALHRLVAALRGDPRHEPPLKAGPAVAQPEATVAPPEGAER